jgi:hypothetical protein
MYHHGIVSQPSYVRAHEACGWQKYLAACPGLPFKNKTVECLDAVDICIEEIPRDVDIYNIDAEVCLEKEVDRLSYTAAWNPLARIMQAKRRTTSMTATGSSKGVSYEPGFPIDPCLENYVPQYLNRPDVQTALHVRPTKWATFGPIRYLTEYDDMTKLWPEFFRHPRAQNWRIVIVCTSRVLFVTTRHMFSLAFTHPAQYSGDFDACVPFDGTQHWIGCLNRPIVNGWHPWRVNGQVAGNVVQYDKLSFVTIKGSGHMVPTVTPVKGFAFFQRFIDKQPW